MDEENEEVFSAICIKIIEEQTMQLEKVLKNHSLQAPRIVANIIKECIDRQIQNEYFEKPVRILAEYIRDASIYKRRRLGKRISQLDIVPRILICRELLSLGLQNFPLDLCMSKSGWNNVSKTEEVMKFRKPKNMIAMAFGDNSYGKLGIGSDVERVDVLTPVILPGKVANIFMSELHTIFVLKSGDVYGCGKASNFMEGAQGSDENILTPVKIPLSRKDLHKSPIILTHVNTTILDYTEQSYLVFGEFDVTEEMRVLSEGANWKIIQKRPFCDCQIIKELENKQIVVDGHNGEHRMMTVREDGAWINGVFGKTEIIFLVDGFRVNSEKFWKNYRVNANGEILAVADDNVYKGKLLMVPRGMENGEGEDTDEDYKDSMDEDVQVIPKEVMLAKMEEIAFPMGFDNIQSTFDGKSYILYNKPTDESANFCEKLPRFRPEAMNDNLILGFNFTSQLVYGPQLLETFREIREKMDVKVFPDWFDSCGLPSCDIRELLTLEHFLRIDNKTKLTKVFVENINDDDTLDDEAIRKELQKSYKYGNKIPVLVVKAGWTNDERKERERQVRNRARDYILDLLDSVEGLLRKLNSVPMKYRANKMDAAFGAYVNYLINSISFNIDIFMESFESPDGNFNRNHCSKAMQERLANNDLDGEEDRWKLVRVEAMPIEHQRRESRYYHLYNIHTTRFHIQCIAPELLEFIDTNNILNLNMVCLHDASPSRYIRYLDSFFLINDSDIHLKTFERKIDVISVAKSLPENETYTVTTSDKKVLTVPKVLFEVFSEFDAGRKRASSMTGEDADNFQMSQCNEETLELLLACLIDVRVFYKASMDLKIQVYHASLFYLFEHLRAEMLWMIVETAEEKDYAYIAELLSQDMNDTLIELIARRRPDILIFWKNIPIQGNYIPMLSKMSKLIDVSCFERVSPFIDYQHRPIMASKDRTVDKERISHKFMKKLISNHEKDEDVNIDLVKTILTWDPDTPPSRKRPYPSMPEYSPANGRMPTPVYVPS